MASDLLELVKKVENISEKKGYITFDDMMDIAIDEDLNVVEVDKLSSAVVNKGIIIYEKEPETKDIKAEDISDYAKVDYEDIFNAIVKKCENISDFIKEVQDIIPPQYGELSSLPYKVLEGNEYARNRMIEMHLRQAIRIGFQRADMFELDLEDVISDSLLGLITAVDKFEPDVNDTFGGYMGLWCLQTISRNQATENPLIYYPLHQKEEYFKIYPELREKCNNQGKHIEFTNKNVSFIMERLQCSSDLAEQLLLACMNCNLLDEDEMEEKELKSLYVSPSPLEEIEEHVTYAYIKEKIFEYLTKRLTTREKKVIMYRFGLDGKEEKTLEEIGKIMGVTRERIRQIEKKAMVKLQKDKRNPLLQSLYSIIL